MYIKEKMSSIVLLYVLHVCVAILCVWRALLNIPGMLYSQYIMSCKRARCDRAIESLNPVIQMFGDAGNVIEHFLWDMAWREWRKDGGEALLASMKAFHTDCVQQHIENESTREIEKECNIANDATRECSKCIFSPLAMFDWDKRNVCECFSCLVLDDRDLCPGESKYFRIRRF